MAIQLQMAIISSPTMLTMLQTMLAFLIKVPMPFINNHRATFPLLQVAVEAINQHRVVHHLVLGMFLLFLILRLPRIAMVSAISKLDLL